MPRRPFTLDEAIALLPRLEPLMRALVEKRQAMQERQQALEQIRARAMGDGGALRGEGVQRLKQELEQLVGEINGGIEQIGAWGVVVKDLDKGLVDFLSVRGGKEVFLCWRLGEPTIAYWHGLDEGFAGRKPIRGDPL